MVQMRITQLGGMAMLPFRQKLFDGQTYSSKVESARPLSAIEDVVRDMKYTGQKNRKMKIKTYIVSDVSDYLASDFYQYIKGNVGSVIPIVAYVVKDNRFTVEQNCSNECCLDFITALGIITKIGVPTQSDYNSPFEVDISIEFTTYWSPIDHYLWDIAYTSQQTMQNSVTVDVDHSYTVPNCRQVLSRKKDCVFVFMPMQYDNYEFMYDPVFMDNSIEENSRKDPFSCCGNDVGFSSTYTLPVFSETLYMRSSFYNAPPKPLIVYEGILGDSPITFKANSSGSGMTNRTYESKILVEETNEILTNKGYSELNINDKMVVGDFLYTASGQILRNGIIVKNGNVISDVQPVITSDGSFFGYLDPAPDAKISSFGDYEYCHIRYLYRRA